MIAQHRPAASFLLSSCSSKQAAQAPLSQDELDKRARDFAGFMSGGKPADAVKLMEPRMAAALPEAKVAELRSGLLTQLGTFQAISKTRYAEESGFRIIYVACAFKDADIEAKIVFDASGKVTGLWFGAPQPRTSGVYSPPAYAEQASFTEAELFVGEGQWKLPATLTMPGGEGPFPGVVLVQGSGPNDRDETVGPNKPFKDLAWGLASKGIAVLRYEKRTLQYASQLEGVSSFTVDEETVDDAVAAAKALRETNKINPDEVFVLGHSLGAMLAPRIAARSAGELGRPLKGVILMAGNARSFLDLVVEQVQYIASLDGKVDDAESKQIQEIVAQVAAIRDGKLKPGEAALGAPQTYWADLLKYDPVVTARSLDLPMFVMQGEPDYQVTMADFGLWKDALGSRPNVTLKSYPDLNHLFVTGQGRSMPSEYMMPGNVSGEAVDDIAAWIKGS